MLTHKMEVKENPKERQEQVDPILLDPNLKVEDAINFTKGGEL